MSSSLQSLFWLLCSLIAVVSTAQHADLHNKLLAQRNENIHARQEAAASTFTSTLVFSYTSYSPVPATDTTTFAAGLVTSTAVLTVTAEDQFHALQSFLTAGQSVIDSAKSSAAQATRSPTLPISTSVSVTSVSSPPTTTSGPSSGAVTIAPVTSTTRQGAGVITHPSWWQHCLTFFFAMFAWEH